ncbi:MAG: DUF2157 domain-containing protein [Verrucomicrobiales bacterium]|jgi:hypothetical protein|nr:DUF2157 domain-containing protein [Verrucomicrobiales bacterium]
MVYLAGVWHDGGMSDARFAKQLVGELPGLVEKNILSTDGAAALRRHYAPLAVGKSGLSIGLTISAILGGLLVGAGIILLLAHNWDDLSRPARAGISIAPLLVSIGLSGFALWRRSTSATWREGCGAFYFLSIGAAIALVSQTYHLYNDLEAFLCVWLMLTLPLVYLSGAGTAFVGFLACAVAYNAELNYYNESLFNFAPLAWLAAALPFFVWQVRKRRESLTVTWLAAALAVSGVVVLLAYSDKLDFTYYWQVAFAALFTLYYLVACRWFGGARGWRNPFRVVGGLGIAVIAVTLTFKDVFQHPPDWSAFASSPFAVGWLLAAAGWMALTVSLAWRKIPFNWAAVLFPGFVSVSVFGLPHVHAPLLMNAYVLALGVFTLVRGARRDSLLSMNEGVILLVALMVSRFFNEDYDFVARGVAFVMVGAGFLGMNAWVLVKRKNKKELSV